MVSYLCTNKCSSSYSLSHICKHSWPLILDQLSTCLHIRLQALFDTVDSIFLHLNYLLLNYYYASSLLPACTPTKVSRKFWLLLSSGPVCSPSIISNLHSVRTLSLWCSRVFGTYVLIMRLLVWPSSRLGSMRVLVGKWHVKWSVPDNETSLVEMSKSLGQIWLTYLKWLIISSLEEMA